MPERSTKVDPRCMVWVTGEWPDAARAAHPFGYHPTVGAVVTDWRTGAHVLVRARTWLSHERDAEGRWRVLPAVQGELLERQGDVIRVRFADALVIYVQQRTAEPAAA